MQGQASLSAMDDTLCEVVDRFNHPLCIMPEHEILRQKLLHRAVALLLRASDGRMLLRWHPESGFVFSSFGMLPAGLSAEDFCARLRSRDWLLEGGSLFRLAVLEPCQETRNAFASLFESRISPAYARELAREPDKNLLLDRAELAALTEREGLVSPLVSRCAEILLHGRG